MKQAYKRNLCFFIVSIAFVCVVFILWWRFPLLGDGINKQTIYVGLSQAWQGALNDTQAHALWIDDDSTPGVFVVKEIADEIGMAPCFAVIADNMEKEVADSLASWQRQGAGIVLHGLQHRPWKGWGEAQIEEDIHQSYKRLYEQGFDTARIMKMIVPPHGCNTRVIRKVIKRHGCQMITGANLVNNGLCPFMLGRIGISADTDIDEMRVLLQKAYDRRAFVIFTTHSSMFRAETKDTSGQTPHGHEAALTREKTKAILKMAKEMGFCFNFSD